MLLFKRLTLFFYILIFYCFFISCSNAKKIVVPPSPPINETLKDNDGDGVSDADDKCPGIAGLASLQGCPDRDGDGLIDIEDKCPDVAGLARYQGCPIPDTDGDGVNDEEDKCINYRGPAVNFGCPVIVEEIIQKVNAIDPPRRDSVKTQKSSYPQVSLAYAFKDKMKVHDTGKISVIIQVNKTRPEIKIVLQDELGETKLIKRGITDSSIVKTLSLTGGKYFTVKVVDYVRSDFDIALMEGCTERQELNLERGNKWFWKIISKRVTHLSGIMLLVTVEGDDKTTKQFDHEVLPIEITVNEDVLAKPPLNNVIPPADNKVPKQDERTFFSRYKWLFLVPVAVLGLLIFLLRKKRNPSAPPVYFSYAWKIEKDFIDKLFNSLQADGINVKRDIEDLEVRKRISGFMDEIGKADFVIIAISDKYLRSEYCMNELYWIYANSGMDEEKFINKIFPIRLEEIDLHKADVISDYTMFWKAREDELEKQIQESADNSDPKLAEQHLAIKRLITDIGPILRILSDILTLSKEQASKDNFSDIKKEIREWIDPQSGSKERA